MLSVNLLRLTRLVINIIMRKTRLIVIRRIIRIITRTSKNKKKLPTSLLIDQTVKKAEKLKNKSKERKN